MKTIIRAEELLGTKNSAIYTYEAEDDKATEVWVFTRGEVVLTTSYVRFDPQFPNMQVQAVWAAGVYRIDMERCGKGNVNLYLVGRERAEKRAEPHKMMDNTEASIVWDYDTACGRWADHDPKYEFKADYLAARGDLSLVV